MVEKPKFPSHRVSIGPLYLTLICCLIIVILAVNGFFEINRTRKNLRDILENQGVTLLRGLEREVQNTVSVIEAMEGVPGGPLLNIASSIDFFALEDAVVNYLLEIAAEVDQNDSQVTLSPSELKTLAEQKGLKRIDILRDLSRSSVPEKYLSFYRSLLEGNRDIVIIPFEKVLPDEKDLFSVVIGRTGGKGVIAVGIDDSQMKNLRRRFAIQNVLVSMGFGEGVQYLSIFDRTLSPIAQLKGEGIGEIGDPSFLKSVQEGKEPKSRFRSIPTGQEVLEIAQILHLGENPFGVMQMGLSTLQIQNVLSLSRRSVILSVVVLLALGITGVTLIYVNQNRHLRKLREMEERTRAAERLLSVGKLGAGLAHEIRNPLNAVAMAIQRLQREFLPREDQQAREYGSFIQVIRDEVNRLSQIVDRFVLFSKPEKLALAPTSVAEILDNLSVLFSEEVKERSIVIHKEVAPKLPTLFIDKGRITQALVNIVTNGLHAMERGGKLTLMAEMVRKDWVKITVSDTGTGIAEEDMERIFDYSYTTREKGLGLGLPIAHKIIEEHGGRITIESQVGEGTAVSFFLPITER